MGANYDMIIAGMVRASDANHLVEGFLRENGFCPFNYSTLDSNNHIDEPAVLLGPATNGFVQVVADNRSLDIPLAEWFEKNPLAAALSRHCKQTLHCWTLDSGFVAGYAIFESGSCVENDVVFTEQAVRTDELCEGVAAPRRCPGTRLGTLLSTSPFDFAVFIGADNSLERGIGKIVSGFGFDVHLLDYYEAFDERQGITMQTNHYESVQLKGWRAMHFETDSTPVQPA